MIRLMLKRLLLMLAAIVVILQFIRPDRTVPASDPADDISTVLNVPDEVQLILRTSCYDCHSNTTMYPWYAEVQPVGWWLNSHIQDARKDLNFSEFGTYPARRQYIKVQQIVEEVTDDEMPLPSYLIMHADARLSQEQKARLVAWATAAQESMRVSYPPEDLERSKRD
jgi:hypothetical protein